MSDSIYDDFGDLTIDCEYMDYGGHDLLDISFIQDCECLSHQFTFDEAERLLKFLRKSIEQQKKIHKNYKGRK